MNGATYPPYISSISFGETALDTLSGSTYLHPVVLARISAYLAMKLTRIDLDSVFGCVFSPLHPGAKGYAEILCGRRHARLRSLL